jgi:hypothetical protein
MLPKVSCTTEILRKSGGLLLHLLLLRRFCVDAAPGTDTRGARAAPNLAKKNSALSG